jgi:hypothetical protein
MVSRDLAKVIDPSGNGIRIYRRARVNRGVAAATVQVAEISGTSHDLAEVVNPARGTEQVERCVSADGATIR